MAIESKQAQQVFGGLMALEAAFRLLVQRVDNPQDFALAFEPHANTLCAALASLPAAAEGARSLLDSLYDISG